MSGKMQDNSDSAVRPSSEETRAGGPTTPVLWRAEASLRIKRMVSALVTASREANNLLREVSYCSHNPRFDTERDIPDEETNFKQCVIADSSSEVAPKMIGDQITYRSYGFERFSNLSSGRRA